ncbi:DUF4867 family protein [Treponema sp. OMZ 840]|uniref:DUF4867 family protein n=1 Tax=Treponema sp. OMZ 840 TaxID=244313 RepID=UPI003D8C32DE
MRKIKAKEISAENFGLYGSFTDLLNPHGYCLGDFYPDRLLEPAKTTLPLAFSPLIVHKPKQMLIHVVEYHNYTGEIFLPLDTDVVIHVAPASNVLVPEKTEAFIVRKGTIVRFNTGVYHYAPFSIEKDEGRVLIVLPERTYMNDCCVFEYEEKDRMEIVL